MKNMINFELHMIQKMQVSMPSFSKIVKNHTLIQKILTIKVESLFN